MQLPVSAGTFSPIEREDATTLWETYDPEVRDLRRFFSHLEPGFFGAMSLCHGWGSGLVPLSARWLAGIDIKDVRVRDAVRTVAEDRRQELADLLASEDAENESHGQRRTE